MASLGTRTWCLAKPPGDLELHGHVEEDPMSLPPPRRGSLFWVLEHMDSGVPASPGTLTWRLGAPAGGFEGRGLMCEDHMSLSPHASLYQHREHVDSEVGRHWLGHWGHLPGSWVHPSEILRTMDTCEKTLCRYPTARRCSGSLNTWTLTDGPLPGGWVNPQEVLRAMNTCENSPCRYRLARLCSGSSNTWTPEYQRHRRPLPGS